MCSSINLLCLTFFGLLCLQQVIEAANIDIPQYKDHLNVMPSKRSFGFKQSEPSYWIQENPRFITTSKTSQKSRKVQRRDVPFQQNFLGFTVKSENEDKSQFAKSQNYRQQSASSKFPTAKPLIKTNETEAERAERIHKSFERLLTFVEIVGQVDNYVSNKWKNLVKTVSNFYEVEDEPYRVSAKRIYGACSGIN